MMSKIAREVIEHNGFLQQFSAVHTVGHFILFYLLSFSAMAATETRALTILYF
jgi:hypothetical protein